jgi:hypothetical protein
VIPYLGRKKKKNSQKRAGGVTQGVGPEFKPQSRQKKSDIVCLLITSIICIKMIALKVIGRLVKVLLLYLLCDLQRLKFRILHIPYLGMRCKMLELLQTQ